MILTDQLRSLVLLHAIRRHAAAIESELQRHNSLLARLVDHLVPPAVDPEPVPPDLRSIETTSDQDQAEIQETWERLHRTLHRPPTDEEVLEALAER